MWYTRFREVIKDKNGSNGGNWFILQLRIIERCTGRTSESMKSWGNQWMRKDLPVDRNYEQGVNGHVERNVLRHRHQRAHEVGKDPALSKVIL